MNFALCTLKITSYTHGIDFCGILYSIHMVQLIVLLRSLFYRVKLLLRSLIQGACTLQAQRQNTYGYIIKLVMCLLIIVHFGGYPSHFPLLQSRLWKPDTT